MMTRIFRQRVFLLLRKFNCACHSEFSALKMRNHSMVA